MNENQERVLCYAFTTEGYRKLNRLTNEVAVSRKGKQIVCTALWDTGAAITCISHQIVQALGLIPTGSITLLGASGAARKGTYLVDITLPNKVTIPNVNVSEAELMSNIDILIGMDLIGYGDFAVSNYQDNTVFTFRIPSVRKADYCQELNQNQLPPDETIA